jgi:hypothetical protein
MKLPRPHSKDVYHNTTVKEDLPWKLQQIQVNKELSRSSVVGRVRIRIRNTGVKYKNSVILLFSSSFYYTTCSRTSPAYPGTENKNIFYTFISVIINKDYSRSGKFLGKWKNIILVKSHIIVSYLKKGRKCFEL